MPTATDRRPLTGWHLFGLYFAMITALSALTLTTPTVIAHSTTLPTALAWTGPWAGIVLVLASLTWWVARRTGAGVRDGYGIAPRWACSHRRLVRTEHALDAAIIGGLALSLYLAAYGFIWVMGPTPQGRWPVVLFTQTTTAIISELVVLGVLATFLTTTRMSGQTFVLASMASRIVIAAPHWPALVAAGLGGAAVAALYLNTRRLTPIIIGHTTATAVVTLTGAWVSWLS
ncbi:CPBP family glutamic-type intramembrane protease [Nocardiopsis terrae]